VGTGSGLATPGAGLPWRVSRRGLLGDGPRTLEEGVLDRVVDTDLWSLERRRGVRARLWAGRRLPMLVEIL
jgi:hypothetical protein